MIMPRAGDQLLMPVNPLFVWTTLVVAFSLNVIPAQARPSAQY